MSTSYVVDVIAGDGIGQEVMPAAITCIDALTTDNNFTITAPPRLGSDHYRRTGRTMPVHGLDQLATGDARLLGAADIPDDVWIVNQPK